MDLAPYISNLRHELAVAAAAGGEDARALAERLTAPLESAARLALLEALSGAADEITRELAPGSVHVRLRGRDAGFVVTPPPGDLAGEPGDAEPRVGPLAGPDPRLPPGPEDDGGALARINLRLPEQLKARAEAAAEQAGLSVNSWLVRAVTVALGPASPGSGPGGPGRRAPRGRQHYTGWVR